MSHLTIADIIDPRGRTDRKGLIVGAVILIGLQLGIYGAQAATGSPLPLAVFSGLQAVFVWLSLVLVAKRLHDLGFGLRHALAGLATIAAMGFATALGAATLFGEEALLPGGTGYFALAAAIFTPFAAITIWLHCAPGQKVANRYGEVPGPTGFSHPANRELQVSSAAALS